MTAFVDVGVSTLATALIVLLTLMACAGIALCAAILRGGPSRREARSIKAHRKARERLRRRQLP